MKFRILYIELELAYLSTSWFYQEGIHWLDKWPEILVQPQLLIRVSYEQMEDLKTTLDTTNDLALGNQKVRNGKVRN